MRPPIAHIYARVNCSAIRVGALAYKGDRKTCFDDHGFSGFCLSSTTPDHTTPAYSGIRRQTSAFKCSSENPQGNISETTRWIVIFKQWNLDKYLSKKQIRFATPALWLSSPHWAKCMTNSYPLRSPSKQHAKTTALIRWHLVTWVFFDLGISQTVDNCKSTIFHMHLVSNTASSIWK